jgi:segregation and condensation protein B
MGQLKLEERNGELTTVEEKPGQVSGDKAALKASLEAILFSMGDSIDPETIAQALDVSEETIRAVLDEMGKEYESEERGIRIIRLEGRYQLATKKELYPVLIRLVRQPKKISLSDVVLETLSIVAYKQPVTRAQIEKIRGVSCDHAINRLLEYGLICEAGRLDAPGRPILFGTTEEFLRHFGTDSLDELPRISPVKVEDFKAEAEEEAKMKLEV